MVVYYLYFNNLMRRQLSQKDANTSTFLDKFLGKTSKIGKKGISGVIAEARN